MHILLVEDNQADATLLMELFAEKSDSLVQWVKDGYDALDYVFQRGQYAHAIRPDIVLLDLGLPRVNGYEVLKELKHHALFSAIPVIILTTSRNPLHRSQCEAVGANSFLCKPQDLKGYRELVRQIINSEFPRLGAEEEK